MDKRVCKMRWLTSFIFAIPVALSLQLLVSSLSGCSGFQQPRKGPGENSSFGDNGTLSVYSSTCPG